MRRAWAGLLLCALSAAAVDAQEKKKPKGAVDFQAEFQERVDTAIKKGVAYLKQAELVDGGELLLLTLLHAGRDLVPDNDPLLQSLLKNAVEGQLSTTYRTALIAMSLEELNRVKYQTRIWQCAQFLVDNQNKTGAWGYGEPTQFLDGVPTGQPAKRKAASGGGRKVVEFDPSGPRQKPEVRTLLPVVQRREATVHYDNSNSQYAALGLRACHDSGIQLPPEVIRRAHKWWADHSTAGEGGKDVATGPSAKPRSWGYQGGGACGAMTVGALGAMAIYDCILDGQLSWAKDPAVNGALAWLGQNFKVDKNAGQCEHQTNGSDRWVYYYYLYAVERAGMLYGTETFGKHEWYKEGAQQLLKDQQPDGSWFAGKFEQPTRPVWDTCWAILFLRRATRPLDVATEAARR